LPGLPPINTSVLKEEDPPPPPVPPPELLIIPISTGSPHPYSAPLDKGKPEKLHDAIASSHKVKGISLSGGVTTHAKQWIAIERITSLITYSTAIESYDIGTYDYTTGEGVSYTVNLAVCDITIEHPV